MTRSLTTSVEAKCHNNKQNIFESYENQTLYFVTSCTTFTATTMEHLEDKKFSEDLQRILVKYENACRLCLSDTRILHDSESHVEIQLFSTKEEGMRYVELIRNTVSVDIKSDDLLPKRLCNSCVSKLDLYSSFQRTCKNTDRILNEMFYPETSQFKSTNTEKIATSSHIGSKSSEQLENATNVIEIKNETNSFEMNVTETSTKIIVETQTHQKSQQNETTLEKHRKVCEECGLTFVTNRTLRLHRISKHVGRKDFCCSICNKTFARKFHLDMHMRIHLKIRPHICETCASSFSTSSDLTRHRRIHSDIKNYGCVVCEARFKRSSDRNKHMRTHTGERRFCCESCNKTYTSRSGLVKHLQRNHSTALKDKEERTEQGIKC